MKGWKNLRLKEFCEFKYGKNLPEHSRVKGLYPVYGSSSVISYHNQFLVKGPGIIVGRKGTVGKVQFSKSDFFPIDTTFFIEAKEDKADIKFLYYRLSLCGLEDMNSDAAVPGLNRDAASSLKIFLPPLPTQKKIAGILSAYDDAIENNLRRIKLLEEMAQITYEEWFLRLRFPGHESTPINEATGLPEGWEKEKVGNVLSKIKTTKKIQNSEFLPKGLIPIVDQSRDFIAGYTDEPEALLNMDQPLIIFGDHTRILKFINFPFARGADGTQVLLSKEPRMPQHLFYLSLIAVDLSNYHYARHFKFLKDSEIILPSKEVADEFEKYSNDKFTLIRELRNQNQHLREARDILLPRLMTGVIDAEKYQPENLLKEIA